MCLAIPGKVEEITTDGLIRDGAGELWRRGEERLPGLRARGRGGRLHHCPCGVCHLEDRRGDAPNRRSQTFAPWACWRKSWPSEEEAFARAAKAPQSSCPDGSCESDGQSARRESRSARLRVGRFAGKRSAMKYLTEFRNGEIAQRMAREIHSGRHAAVEDHGGVRRADALHHQERHRPDAAGRDRDDSRAGLPGVRHAAGADRQGAGHCGAAGSDFLLVRRHAAGAGHRCATCFR